MDSSRFMSLAIEEAEKAYQEDEVPVGAVIARGGGVIAAAHNGTRQSGIPTRHAEIIALEKAAAAIGNERLTGCDLYVTKEPCAMCAGAIVHARLSRVFIGTRDARYGACGTVLSVCGNSALNHVPEIIFGVLGAESAALLRKFFREKRQADP